MKDKLLHQFHCDCYIVCFPLQEVSYDVNNIHSPVYVSDVQPVVDVIFFHAVLRCCWFGDRKGIGPVKKLDVGLLVMI